MLCAKCSKVINPNQKLFFNNQGEDICYTCHREQYKKDWKAKYGKSYRQRLEVKVKRKEYLKKYRQKNKVRLLKEQREYQQRPETKARIKRYRQQPKVKARIKRYILINKQHQIRIRLRNLVNQAFNYYSKTGKILTSKQYGINYKAIIECLKPFPEDISKYHIDHIKPLCYFNLENPEQIKLAFAPENHQWLLAKDNLSKGSKF